VLSIVDPPGSGSEGAIASTGTLTLTYDGVGGWTGTALGTENLDVSTIVGDDTYVEFDLHEVAFPPGAGVATRLRYATGRI